MQRLILVTLGLVSFVAFSDAAVATVVMKVGKPFSFDFGEGHYVIRRVTEAIEGSQYIFAGPSCAHGWTFATSVQRLETYGTSLLNQNTQKARLFWNGTLVIDKVADNDVGDYYRPLEKTSPNVAPTQYVFQLE